MDLLCANYFLRKWETDHLDRRWEHEVFLRGIGMPDAAAAAEAAAISEFGSEVISDLILRTNSAESELISELFRSELFDTAK